MYHIARMSPRCRRQIESEAEYLPILNHQNVIKYFGTCLGKKTIIMERMAFILHTSSSDSQCRVNNIREYLDCCTILDLEDSPQNYKLLIFYAGHPAYERGHVLSLEQEVTELVIVELFMM